MKESLFNFHLVVVLFFLLCPCNIFSNTVNWQGQSTVWGIVSHTDSTNTQLAGRYITSLSSSINLSESIFADAYISSNTFFESRFNYDNKSWNSTNNDFKTKLYRCYARLSMTNVDLRIGLQRLNFGSALLLRPLKWFDGLDPRDPTQFSEGVYGGLFRVFFNNNTNIWLWGLYGNNELKGWELFPTRDDKIEFGYRIQYPIYTGEVAFTYHQREFDLSGYLRTGFPAPAEMLTEKKYAFDLRLDIEIGFWSEFVLVDRSSEFFLNRWQRFINIGADYTIGIGNGVRLTGEYIEIGEPIKPFGSSNPVQYFTNSLDYTLGIVDVLKGVFYYDVKQKELYNFIAWIHTLDNWQFSFNGFWNPRTRLINNDSNDILVGKGMQLSITFNH